MFFVSGITGKVGGAVARSLLARGRSVRALVRDAGKAQAWVGQGVDVRQGDLDDAGAVAKALAGVEGAFLMLPPVLAPAPGYPEARATIASYVAALARTPVPRLALLSSIGSEKTSGLGLITGTHLLEEATRDLGVPVAPIPVAVVRAASFIDNYLFGVRAAAASGVFDSFLTPVDRATPHVATADIGEEVARLLDAGWSGRQVIELGSPLSPNDVARAMADVLGRPVVARAIPRDGWAARLQAIGLAPGTTGAYEEMQDGFNTRWIDFGIPGTTAVAATTTAAEVFAAAQCG